MSKFRDRVRDGAIERFSICCKQWLAIGEFRKAKNVKHGRLYRCKLCYAETRKKYRTKPNAIKRSARRRAKYLRLRKAGYLPQEASRLV